MSSRFTRVMHRMHRALGSAFAMLVALWCTTGAVMTFSDYPRFTDSERLARSEPLPSAASLGVPPELSRWIMEGGLERGERARLSMLEGRATWTFNTRSGERRALRAEPPWALSPLDERRATRVAEVQFAAKAASVRRMVRADQWTVARWRVASSPLFHVRLEEALGREVYVAAHTGEIVQESTRRERLLAWLGAIPHWIYPAALRERRDVWRAVVLAVAALSLVASLSGLLVGVDVQRALGRRRRLSSRTDRIRDPVLRLHHRLGLLFGGVISTWLFSGMLSLAPFAWSCPPGLSDREHAELYALERRERDLPLSQIVLRCAALLPGLRELELAAFTGHLYAVCVNGQGETRILDTGDPTLRPASVLSAAAFSRLVPSRPGQDVSFEQTYDAYHYPTHREPQAALPYVRVVRGLTTLYLDPARARLIAVHTQASRLTRWLYHGLHSFDLPGLYQRRALWRTVVITLMVVATSVALLGMALLGRRWIRSGVRGR